MNISNDSLALLLNSILYRIRRFKMATSEPTPQIKIIPLTKNSCCGYCFASPDEMKYPLALPCGHPQCKECIELDLAMNFDAQCKICR